MTKPALLLLFLGLLEGCSGKTQQDLCTRHIETPTFPPIARTAHVTGKITLTVTIDANGRVTNARNRRRHFSSGNPRIRFCRNLLSRTCSTGRLRTLRPFRTPRR